MNTIEMVRDSGNWGDRALKIYLRLQFSGHRALLLSYPILDKDSRKDLNNWEKMKYIYIQYIRFEEN